MKKITAKIEVKFKDGVLDPQGETIKNALHNLNYKEVKSVRTGKLFWVELEADSQPKAQKIAGDLSDKLLANPVIENFEVKIE
jgi:phosphoribosylformylglycinamidine synthase PurS subunit